MPVAVWSREDTDKSSKQNQEMSVPGLPTLKIIKHTIPTGPKLFWLSHSYLLRNNHLTLGHSRSQGWCRVGTTFQTCLLGGGCVYCSNYRHQTTHLLRKEADVWSGQTWWLILHQPGSRQGQTQTVTAYLWMDGCIGCIYTCICMYVQTYRDRSFIDR